MNLSENLLCLGIESSCDETAAAVVTGDMRVLSNIIASQIDSHREYGGVVPEIASRLHLDAILPVVDEALNAAGVRLENIDLFAVTAGPGLVGSLLVGVSAAKAFAASMNKPLVAVNHIEGHIYANLLEDSDLHGEFIALVVSGGHSHILYVNEEMEYNVVARTRDDAAGEAFDKVARESGLGYPGGPAIAKAAEGGNPYAINFPVTRFKETSLDFSFSGIKTFALNFLNKSRMEAAHRGIEVENIIPMKDFAASFQMAIVKVLVENTIEASLSAGKVPICLAGGVAANQILREKMREACERENVRLYVPKPVFCTDNAAMIACAGIIEAKKGKFAGSDLNAYTSLIK